MEIKKAVDLLKLIEEYWNEFRMKLINKELTYDDIENIKKTKFIDRIDDAISNSEQFAICKLSDINLMLRSCKGKQVDKNRFNPLKKGDNNWNIYKDKLSCNRFNMPEKGFMYLGIDKKEDPKTINYIKNVCLNEIRAFDDSENEFVSTLRFKYTYKSRNKKVLDFSQISKYKTTDDIIKELELILESYSKAQNLSSSFIRTLNEEYLMKMLLKLVNDSTFKEINKKNCNTKELNEKLQIEYAPFHAFANYLLKDKEYAGIIYISTVCDGLNLVLFNREDVEFCDEIMIDSIKELKS